MCFYKYNCTIHLNNLKAHQSSITSNQFHKIKLVQKLKRARAKAEKLNQFKIYKSTRKHEKTSMTKMKKHDEENQKFAGKQDRLILTAFSFQFIFLCFPFYLYRQKESRKFVKLFYLLNFIP